jgi:hypothetical protein
MFEPTMYIDCLRNDGLAGTNQTSAIKNDQASSHRQSGLEVSIKAYFKYLW